jgi:hypothetical protein
MLVTLAGRRIDAIDAKEIRFPLKNVELVTRGVREMLTQQQAKALVCAAACGADLLALSVAGDLRLHRKIVLPFSRERFRETSVVDRPGDWGPLYDRILDEVEGKGDLVVMAPASDDEAYAAGNLAILDQAIQLGRELHEPVTAALVWDGASRGSSDVTEGFGIEARRRGLTIVEVKTL